MEGGKGRDAEKGRKKGTPNRWQHSVSRGKKEPFQRDRRFAKAKIIPASCERDSAALSR